MINIIITDDHQIVIEGIASLLEGKKGIQVLATATSGKELLEQLHRLEVNLVVLDIQMPDMDGIEATKQIKEKFPNVEVLILSMFNQSSYIDAVLEAGASGYVLKNKGSKDLVAAIQAIVAGEDYFSPEVIQTMVEAKRKPIAKTGTGIEVKLTPREIEVMEFIADGLTSPEIATKLFRQTSTIEAHRRSLLEKLGLKNSFMLVRYAVENGFVKEKE